MLSRQKHVVIFSWILLLAGLAKVHAQAPSLRFKHITTEQGLSNSTIETVFQDSRGFLWFGTRDGLNRYDGRQMRVFRYSSGDSASISDNYIRCIYEDRDHVLWIGTINGLNRFDPALNRFRRYRHEGANPATLGHNTVTQIRGDREGRLWIATWGGGLDQLDQKTGRFTHFRHDPLNPRTLSSDQVSGLLEDSQGNFWVTTDNGLNSFNRGSGLFRNYNMLAPFTEAAPNRDLRLVCEDRMGQLILATQDNGLIFFNPRDSSFHTYRHDVKDPASLAGNQVRTVLVDRQWNLWIGGINGGLDLFDRDRGNFHHYQNEPENPGSLSQRTVSALFGDVQGNLWVGTHRGGINLYTPGTEKFALIRPRPNGNGLSYNDVRAFCEDWKGNIWIGTDGGGLNLLDPKTQTFRHFRYDPFNQSGLSSDAVLNITQDKEGFLWISTWGGGLCRLNADGQSFTRFMHDDADEGSISSNYIQQVFEDSKGSLWVASYYGGLELMDRRTGRFKRVVDGGHSTKISGNNIIALNEDHTGNLWIGTDDGGLNCLRASDGSIAHYFDQSDKMPDLRVIFVDRQGRLWVGQSGLFLYDVASDKFNLAGGGVGLSGDFIKGIMQDESGAFWISTANGLMNFHPDKKTFKRYNVADGLQGLEFEANSFLQTRAGEMYFGGVNGFNIFYPESIQSNAYVPPVWLTGFQLFGHEVQPGVDGSSLQTDVGLTHEIRLSHDQSTFSLDFAALNYTASENNQYSYKLENWDKEWQRPGGDARAAYTNIPPGTYVFKVRASNNDGLWNPEPASVTIIISPPFYGTWWFRGLLVALICAGIIVYVYFKRKYEINKLHEEKKEEIHQLQLQFFTNISHEFRTPLSLIMGPLERLQKENTDPKQRHYYQVMSRNAQRLMNLINELMDFRKSESGVLKLNVMPGDLALFLREIGEEFSALANEKEINFAVNVPDGLQEVWFDRQVIEKMLVNLVGNAFKYTNDGGRISVTVLQTMEGYRQLFPNELVLEHAFKGQRYIYVSVADNGIGISRESIAHLFERYYKISDAHLGSGIGLAFVRSLAKLHKTDIYVSSERHQGTEIILGIPVGKEDYAMNERWMPNRGDAAGARLESVVMKGEEDGRLSELDASLGEDDRKSDEPPRENHSSAATKPQVLIVDDNKELLNFLEESFQDLYIVSRATDGVEGLQKTRDEQPDLVISDLMMPRMNGIDLCMAIKQDPATSHIPFIMLTARDAIDSRLKGTGSGADHYFSKPVSIDLLLLTVRNILAQKQKLKERYLNDQYVEASDLAHSTRDKEFIVELNSLVEEHLSNPNLDVDYICSQIGMSKTSLYQRIKRITGQSIGEFIRTVRFRKAAMLMTNEDMPLIEVMYSVGIQTQSYFTKAFKQEFGKTPTQFLKDLKK